MQKLTNHSTNSNTVPKSKSLFCGKILLLCLNKAEHFKVECNGERAAQRVDVCNVSTFYIESDKCLILRKNLRENEFHNVAQ